MKCIVNRSVLETLLRVQRPKGCETLTMTERADVRTWIRLDVADGLLRVTASQLDKKGQPVALPTPLLHEGNASGVKPVPHATCIEADITVPGSIEVPYGLLARIVKADESMNLTLESDADSLYVYADRARFRLLARNQTGTLGPVKRFFGAPVHVPAPVKPKITWMHGQKPAPTAPVETPVPVPVAVVSASVAEAFGMKGLPNTVIVPDLAPVKETPVKQPAPIAPKPAPARVHVPSAKRPPDMPATLSPAAQSIVAALAKLGKPANKAALVAAGVNRADWSDALSEVYRARKVKRAPGADVLHCLA